MHSFRAIALVVYFRMLFVKKMRWIGVSAILIEVITSGMAASEMKWVLLPVGSNGSCVSNTDVCANTFCYGLEYTPDHTGDLTSYTTAFFIDCVNNGSPVLSNTSCVMNNNSSETNGCAQYDLILINSSGNNGSFAVTVGVPVIIHQVCFSIPPGMTVNVVEDEVTDLTTSIDLPGGGFATEYPMYVAYAVVHSNIVTNSNDNGDGSLRNIIGCATAGSNVTFISSLLNQTITLTSGEIDINKNLTIHGPGMLNLSISGNNTSRIFHLLPGYTFTVTGLTLKDGNATVDGGAIFAEGILNLQNSMLRNNFQDSLPKALSVTSTATVNIAGTVEMKN